MAYSHPRKVANWPWALVLLAVAVAVILNACGGGGGGGGKGTGGGGIQGSFTPMTFKSADAKDTGMLTITPTNGFNGSVNVAITTNVAEPGGFKQVPATVTITAPGSPVQVSGSAVQTPISFAWTAWPAGKYEALAVLTSGNITVNVLLQVTVTSSSSGPGLQGAFTPQTFKTTDAKDSASLTITPTNGFSGAVTVNVNTNIAEPVGFQKIPSTVTVTAPGSPVQVPGAAVQTPLNFAWTSWPAGSYEADAVLTSGNVTATIPLKVTVTSGSMGGNPAAVLTWHNDMMRTGNYAVETTLTPSNVKATTFGQLFSHKTNGGMEAEPLYVPDVTIAGAKHNVVYVATLNDFVYAFDADSATGANANPLWTVSLGSPTADGTGGGGDGLPHGVNSTPAIDTTTNTMYLVAETGSGAAAAFHLHALDISTGKEKFGGPVLITGSVKGKAGTVTLNSPNGLQRPGLLLLNGSVYVALGGMFGDPAPDRGWVFAFNSSTLQETNVFTTCPDLNGGGLIGGSVWMGGGALSSDGTYLYVSTANGDFDVNNGGKDYADSMLKLQPSGNTFAVVDYFTPMDQLSDENGDVDFGSGCPMLVPGASNPYVVQVSKDGNAYIVNRNNMGKYDPNANHIVQTDAVSKTEIISSPAYFNGRVYFIGGTANNLLGYVLGGGGLAGAPFGTSSESFFRATPTVSSNGPNNGIVWIVEGSNGSPATLCAYNALTLSKLTTVSAGTYMKYGVPCVASGKVYVPCADGLYVFGNGKFAAKR